MKYYLTTPIYYVNAAPHIGHTYTTLVADLVSRYQTMRGNQVILTTGTDEHGQKIERAAHAAGKTPKEFTDIVAAEFRAQWERLGLRVDRFMRTTDPRHAAKVQELFIRCRDNGYIYKGSYTGQYCVSCELYVSDAAEAAPCPDCQRPTETVTEENYFFKLSAFGQRLLDLYDKQPDFVQPEARRNEVIAFVKQRLSDLSISRTTLKWGIPVPGGGNHVFYVWFDALTTYMSAVEGEAIWPADLHLIGKEILRFHAIYWPAFLWAAGWELPKRVFAHGHLLFEQDKMSKSRGNIVRPQPVADVMGVDALRYFLLREVVFGQDGNFGYAPLVGRYNSDLAHGLGNLASRTLSMIHQYRGGVVPTPHPPLTFPAYITTRPVLAAYEKLEFSRALEIVWSYIQHLDKFIVEMAPWALAKRTDSDSQRTLDNTLYLLADGLCIITALLAPAIPESAQKIWSQLGFSTPLAGQRIDQLGWGQLQAGQKIGVVSAVFPRVEPKPAIARMRELEVQETARQRALLGKVEAKPAEPSPAALISIDDFAKVDMRVGQVVSAERVKGADKLLHLKVDIGEPAPRTIVAGIAQAYQPEQLVGRKVVIVANLQPRKLRGLESQGMIVAASLPDGQPVLTSFLEEVPVGARLS